MKLPIYKVDAFAKKLFTGNPAAVVLCEEELPSRLMQQIAAENNLSDTAYLWQNSGEWQIRWFTPAVEVDLCGHATLAAAHVLFNHTEDSYSEISFASKSGVLTVKRSGDQLLMSLPADLPVKIDASELIERGLGVKLLELYRGRDDLLAVIETEEQLINLAPDFTLISQLNARGVIVSAPGSDCDFVSRFFAPQSGIPEDPVTGSAHTTLTPYWSERLGKTELKARQLSIRGGELFCRAQGERVEIGGRCATYLIGEITLPE